MNLVAAVDPGGGALSAQQLRLFYIDDSGAEDTGIVAYSWIEVAAGDWRTALALWLDWREDLARSAGIPKRYELHATKFANGRGRPSVEEAWNLSKANRVAVMTQALTRIATMGCLQVGSVYRRTTARRAEYRDVRHDVYGELVRLIDERLTRAGELGMIMMDGDGTDESYIRSHRDLELSARSIIEDPMFHVSGRSQWIQMADLTAYAAYQETLAHPGKVFAHGWYPLLRSRDRWGGPRAV